MIMGKKYKNGIETGAGFSYPGPQPLDDRDVVQSYSDLAELVRSDVVYDGIEVYVIDDEKAYKLINGTWEPMATEQYVEEALAKMVDAAPETLDTLNELASALGDNPNFATTIATEIGTKQDKLTAGANINIEDKN